MGRDYERDQKKKDTKVSIQSSSEPLVPVDLSNSDEIAEAYVNSLSAVGQLSIDKIKLAELIYLYKLADQMRKELEAFGDLTLSRQIKGQVSVSANPLLRELRETSKEIREIEKSLLLDKEQLIILMKKMEERETPADVDI